MAILSIILFFATLLIIFLVILWLPSDYFIKEKYTLSPSMVQYRVLFKIWQLIRNILGFILIVVGVIMLILPGQGVLTIIIGLILLEFPGKKHLLHKLIASKSVQNSLNYLRKKMGKPPFIFP